MADGPYWSEALMSAQGDAPSVLAFGDSWFWYPKNNLLLPIFKYAGRPVILAKGGVGLEAKAFVHDIYLKDIRQCLRDYGALRAVLLSGGGNDFAGLDDFAALLKADCRGIDDPSQCFRPSQPARLLRNILQSYRQIIDEVRTRRPAARVVVHAYDYALPSGQGFMGLGQWLKAPMDLCKVKSSLQRDVVRWLIDRFQQALEELSTEYNGRVVVVRSPGTLRDDQWDNELHPTSGGFTRLGRQVWAPAVQALL